MENIKNKNNFKDNILKYKIFYLETLLKLLNFLQLKIKQIIQHHKVLQKKINIFLIKFLILINSLTLSKDFAHFYAEDEIGQYKWT